MGTRQLETEWQALEKEREQLIGKSTQLQKRFAGFLNEIGIADMLKEKDRLKSQIKMLSGEIKHYRNNIEGRERSLKDWRLVMAGKESKKKFEMKRDALLREIKESEQAVKISPAAMQFANQMLMLVDMPMEEIGPYLEQKNADDQRQEDAVPGIIRELLAHIELIEENYRQSKKCLEREIRNAEDKRNAHREKTLEWITRNREHLEWVLAKEPAWASEAQRRYQERWQDDRMANNSRNNASPTRQFPHRRSSRKQKSVAETAPANQTNGNGQRPWEFFITSGKNATRRKLPSERNQFLAAIEPNLRNSVGGLSANMLYDALMRATTEKDACQRQLTIKKIHGPKFRGWQGLEVGNVYRIPIVFKEESRELTFMLSKKGDEFYRRGR